MSLGSQCRKSMARIKYVLNERRLAYLGAEKMQKAAEKKPALKVQQRLERNLKQRRAAKTRASRQEYLVSLLEQKQAVDARKATGVSAHGGGVGPARVDETKLDAAVEESLSKADMEALKLFEKRKQEREIQEAKAAAKLKVAKQKEELERMKTQPANLASAGLFGESEEPGKSS
jgi:large subunit ribosomal protein L47